MQVLTTTGYKELSTALIGEQVVAWDIYTGEPIVNTILNIEEIVCSYDTTWTTNDQDAEGNFIEDEYGNIIQTEHTETIYYNVNSESFKFYKINDTWTLYCQQSIWANMNTTHVELLNVGDIIYDENDNDVEITSIEEVTGEIFWRFTISGDHSYIVDGITVHNASRYLVSGGSGLWNNTNNWSATTGGASGASFPVSTDDVIFDTNSSNANMEVNVASNCTSIDISNYTGTFYFTSSLTVLNITVSTGIVWSYTVGYIYKGGSGNISCNGGTIGVPIFILGASSIHTLLDDCTFSETVILGFSNQIVTINGAFNFNCEGDLNLSSVTSGRISGGASVSTIVMTGTSTITDPTSFYQNINFSINTTGTITIPVGSRIYMVGGIFDNITGTFNCNGYVRFQSSMTVNIGTIIGGAVHFMGGGSYTYTMTGNGYCDWLRFFHGTNTITINGFAIYVSGNLDFNSVSTGTVQGTTTTVLNGTTTITNPTSTGLFRLPLTMDGDVTFNLGNVGYFRYGGTLTYTSGVIDSTNGRLVIANINTTLDLNGFVWNGIIQLQSTITITLLSDFTANGSYIQIGSTTNTTTINGFKIYITSVLTTKGTTTGTVTGTTEIHYIGTGTVDGTTVTNSIFNLTEVINTNGVITFIGNLPRRNGGTINIVKGRLADSLVLSPATVVKTY